MRVAVDTNILAYIEGVNGRNRQAQAKAAMKQIDPDDIVIPVQVLGELFNVLVRKGSKSRLEAEAIVKGWHDGYRVADTNAAVLVNAVDLAIAHQVAIWDAVILAAAAQAQCSMLLSEDMQHGFTWRGVTVRNPFVVS